MYIYSGKKTYAGAIMKILGISGSPRKEGNTEILVREALKAAEEAGAEVEYLSVAGKTIKPCEACDYCVAHKRCHHDDDADLFIEKMVAADGIIMASPVYFGNVTGQVKSLIDRERVMWRQGKTLADKVGASIAVGWKWGFFETLASLDAFFLINKMVVVSNGGVPGLGLMVFSRDKGEVSTNDEALQGARDLGVRVVETVKKMSG